MTFPSENIRKQFILILGKGGIQLKFLKSFDREDIKVIFTTSCKINTTQWSIGPLYILKIYFDNVLFQLFWDRLKMFLHNKEHISLIKMLKCSRLCAKY